MGVACTGTVITIGWSVILARQRRRKQSLIGGEQRKAKRSWLRMLHRKGGWEEEPKHITVHANDHIRGNQARK